MTEPLPCPFCGHVGLSHYEGLTFRWLTTECNGCGAQCGEERINTMTMERSAAIEQAKVEAITTWNTRAAQRKPLFFKEICEAEVIATDDHGNFSLLKFARAIEAAHNIKE